MKISKQTIDRIMDISILEVADKLQIKYSSRGGFRKCHCVMHEDKNPSMWFKVSNNTWSCPVCGKGGGVITLVEESEKLSYVEAVRWLINAFSIPVYDDHDPYRPLKTSKQKTKMKKNITAHIHKSSTINHALGDDRRRLPMQEPSSLDSTYLKTCRSSESPFCKALVTNNILGNSQMLKAAQRYHLGITRDRGVIFWQIDEKQCLRDGKIMFYLPDCHRDHNHDPSFVSYRLIKRGKLPQDWKAGQCLFGLHLVTQKSKVAVVESEKTAVICSELLPEFIWVATGGASYLSTQFLQPLTILKCKIIVFPDTDSDGTMFTKWQDTCRQASQSLRHPIYISNLLELHATEDQKKRKIDIADFIIESL